MTVNPPSMGYDVLVERLVLHGGGPALSLLTMRGIKNESATVELGSDRSLIVISVLITHPPLSLPSPLSMLRMHLNT